MAETTRVVSKIFIRGSITDVWREITKTDQLQKAFFNMRMHRNGDKPGAKVQMRTGNGKYTAVVGEVLEFDPPRRFAHTFRFTQYDDPPCKVIYDLVEVQGGVEFTLTTDELAVGTKTAKDMTRGGDFICKTLKSIVETGRPPFGVRMLHVLFKLLAFTTPKKCRSENWSL